MWKEDLRKQYSVTIFKNKNQIYYYMIHLKDDPKHQALFLESVNLPTSDWIFTCTANIMQGQNRTW